MVKNGNFGQNRNYGQKWKFRSKIKKNIKNLNFHKKV